MNELEIITSRVPLTLNQPPPKGTPRNHAGYTQAQVNEKDAFKRLLYELGKTLPIENQVMGRRRISLPDCVFAAVYKSYVGLSGRRFMSDLRDLHTKGFVTEPLSHNTINNRLRDEALTPVLESLIEGVAASFAHIETEFAVDSSGFRIPKVSKWYDEKWGWRERREWLKCHVSVGVKSHIIAAVKVTKRSIVDHSQLRPMVARTAEQFRVDQVSADSAYSIVANLEYVDELGALPAIPFKAGTNPFRHNENSVWRKMFHLFALNGENWQKAVNQQNQAESAFSMIKRKFGERLFSKDETSQVNELLCKILCHNLCVVLYWLYQFGIGVPEMHIEPVPEDVREVRMARKNMMTEICADCGGPRHALSGQRCRRCYRWRATVERSEEEIINSVPKLIASAEKQTSALLNEIRNLGGSPQERLLLLLEKFS